MPELLSAHIGRIAPLGANQVPSGFVKHPVPGPITVTHHGLAGDQQADRRVHGGPDKAVYGYAAESYEQWRATHPQHAALWQPAGLGENLTLTGLAEEDVCIGDTMRIGTAVLQVTQPREPCFKFALRFNDSSLPKAMIRNGRSGWYYRVITPGTLAAGDPVTLLTRINPNWPIARMNQLIHAKSATATDRAELAALPGLAETWRRQLTRPSR